MQIQKILSVGPDNVFVLFVVFLTHHCITYKHSKPQSSLKHQKYIVFGVLVNFVFSDVSVDYMAWGISVDWVVEGVK